MDCFLPVISVTSEAEQVDYSQQVVFISLKVAVKEQFEQFREFGEVDVEPSYEHHVLT